MNEALIVGIPVAIVAAWVVAPLLGSASRAALHPSDWKLDELIESKHAIYRSILDLELDHKVGKVSDEDYRALRSQHEAEALAVIKQMDQEASSDTAADLLEEEIAAARDRLRGG